jgi:hypothetical protein
MTAAAHDDRASEPLAAGMSVEETAAAALARLPEESLARLQRRYFSRSARRSRRLAERRALLQDAAMRFYVGTGVEIADRMAGDLLNYRNSGWRTGAQPTDPRRLALHRVLQLSDGHRAIGAEAIRKILAGVDRLGNFSSTLSQD